MHAHPNRKIEPERGSDPSQAARVLTDDDVDRMLAEKDEQVEQAPVDVDEDDIERPPLFGK